MVIYGIKCRKRPYCKYVRANELFTSSEFCEAGIVHNMCADNHARKDHRNEITKDRIPTEEAFTRFLAHIQPRTHYPKAVRKHFCSLHNIRAKTSMRY